MDETSGSAGRFTTEVDFLSLAERIVGFGVWSWDFQTRMLVGSSQLFRIYGLEPESKAIDPVDFMELLNPGQAERLRDAVRSSIEDRSTFSIEIGIRRSGDQSERTLFTRGEPVMNGDESLVSIVGVTYDITERTEAERELGFSEKRLRAIIDNIPSLLVVKDLEDRYVMANPVADQAARVDPGGVIGLGTCEAFPDVGLVQLIRDEEVARTGEPIHAEDMFHRDGEDRIYSSVTFALRDDEGEIVETCTIATDVTERSEREAEERARDLWSERIDSALAEERFLVYTQPIVDLEDRKVKSQELLVRMQQQERILSPVDFIPQAEGLGLIQKIDLWMAGQALALSEPVHLNVSAVTLDDPEARADLVRLLDQDRATELVIEITETASLERLGAAREFAEAVTGLGCRLALDDFGVGFGSFTYLRSLPIDYLKVDRQFINGLAGSAANRRLVEGLVGLARGLGVRTIAEGVEDEATSDLVRDLGVDYAQGYLYGRPEPLGA